MIKNIFKMKNLIKIMFLLVLILPSFAFAIPIDPLADPSAFTSAQVCNGSGLENILCIIHRLLNAIVPVLLMLGVVYFVWGVVMYVIADDEEAKKKGKDHVIFGIVGLAIIIGVWGLVNVIVNTFDIGGQQSISVPTFDSTGTGPVSGVPACTGSGVGRLLCTIQQLLNAVLPILFSLGLVYFVWGVVQYMIGDGDEAKSKGKDRVIYGLIGLAIIASVGGLVNVVVDSLGFSASNISVPTLVPTTSGAVSETTCSIGTKVQGLLNYATCLIQNSVIPLLFALAVAFFIWGIVQFIMGSGDETARTKGREHMIWGIIAIAVMLSVWGLVGIVTGSVFGSPINILPKVKPN